MTTQLETMFAQQLMERKHRLEETVARLNNPEEVHRLLHDVDTALEKISQGTFGLCEACQGPIETERLAVDPMVRFCIDHLSSSEQTALERDINLARDIQSALLPRKDIVLSGWQCAYHYQPLGPVSGDYCDIIKDDEYKDSFYFAVGDVTGKGFAASILMSQLHATFRTLARMRLPLDQMMERANRLFCEASLTTHFATLACGLANQNGNVEITNAGHCLPVVIRRGSIETIPSSGLPLGVSCDVKYPTTLLTIGHDDRIVLYTDGLSEATNEAGEQYGEKRLKAFLTDSPSPTPNDLLSASLSDLKSFVGSAEGEDDLTMMVLRKD